MEVGLIKQRAILGSMENLSRLKSMSLILFHQLYKLRIIRKFGLKKRSLRSSPKARKRMAVRK
jgi:hypothetical protein